jgi:diguanylate cyclase (GGDEF)-like protein/PAS domain S-box-containing protein
MLRATDFEALVRTSPNAYLILAPDLTILDVNRAYLRAMGQKRAALIGTHVFDAFADTPNDPRHNSVNRLRASLERVLATRKPDAISLLRYDIPHTTKDGATLEERYWSTVHVPVLDKKTRKVAFLYQSMVDVSDLVNLRNALQAAEAELAAQFRSKGNVFQHSQTLEKTNRVLGEELTQLRRLFDQAPGFMAILRGPEHVFELANRAHYHLFGSQDVIGKPIREVFARGDGTDYLALLDRVFRSGETYVGHEMRALIRRDRTRPQEECYIDFVFQPVFADDGSVSGIFVQGQDVTEAKRARDELRVSNERLRFALEGSGDGLWDWDLVRNEVVYSRRWKEMLDYPDTEIGSSPEEWRQRLHPDDAEAALAALQECLDGHTSAVINEHRLRCRHGGWKWMLMRGIVVARDGDGWPLRIAGTMTDISEKRQSEERIWRHANFDVLTGLPNRRLFRDRLEREVKKAHRNGLQMALLFIDLDRFKEVNDLLGHDAGDMLLVQAAQRLNSCVRESDTVARLGGDEFTVILAELDATGRMAHVEQIAQKILTMLSQPFRLGKEVAYVSGSIGITLYPNDASSPEELIRNADQAMYVAKNAGRNQFSYFTRTMQEEAHVRLRLAGDLRNALGAGQLTVLYQPVVELVSGHIVKAEALLRWQHPTLGAIEPAQFIPLAEESGMINEIGDWVFRQAASWSQHWGEQRGAPFQIGVNKSPVQFVSQSSDADWTGYLTELGLTGSSISIEITEGLLFNASPAVSDRLLAYRDAGIQVALDDFGTGYSSMAYLKKFDIDYLKIDRSFVRDMAVDEGDRAIAESMIVMAHRLGLKVIAEGVETSEQRDLLAAAGCDFGQGFLFAEPAPPERFEQLLKLASRSVMQ